MVPRGSVGRGPSDYEANLHLSYPIKIGDRSRLNGDGGRLQRVRPPGDRAVRRALQPAVGRRRVRRHPGRDLRLWRRHREHPQHARPGRRQSPIRGRRRPTRTTSARASRSPSPAASGSASAGRSSSSLASTKRGGPVRGAPFFFLYCPDAPTLRDRALAIARRRRRRALAAAVLWLTPRGAPRSGGAAAPPGAATVPEIAGASTSAPPVIFVGLDGADWQLLDRWSRTGRCPSSRGWCARERAASWRRSTRRSRRSSGRP